MKEAVMKIFEIIKNKNENTVPKEYEIRYISLK